MSMLPSTVEPQPPNTTVELDNLMKRLMRFEQQAALTELASALTHEANQPLTAIMGYAQSVQITLRNSDAQALPELEQIGESIEKLLDQALRLRDVFVRHRCHAPPTAEHRDMVDLDSVVGDARDVACAEFGARAARIVLRLDASLPAVPADRMALIYVFVSLLRNAIEASDAATPTPIVATGKLLDDGRVELRVRDEGTGVADSLADRLTHPLVSSKPGRLGLGLAICQRSLSLLGGGLSAEPNVPQGTTVRVTLPGVGDKESRDG